MKIVCGMVPMLAVAFTLTAFHDAFGVNTGHGTMIAPVECTKCQATIRLLEILEREKIRNDPTK